MQPTWRLPLICVLSGLAGWALWAFILHNMAGQDWMVFHTAARAWFDGELGHVFDGHWMTGTINQRYAGWLALPLNYHPWLYPPYFLLPLLPFGWLPFGLSYALFLVLTFVLLLAALLCVPAGRVTHPPPSAKAALTFALGLLLFPQTAFIAFTGQNSFLTAALLIAGVALLDRRPLLAGVVLGLVSYKPQLFLMVPVALLAGGHWKAIAAGIVTVALASLCSLAMFGAGPWHDWLGTLDVGSAAYREWMDAARRQGQSVFACLRAVGVPSAPAEAAQGAALLVAAGVVGWAFRRGGPIDLRLMALLAAAVLAAPHLSCQDAILLAAAALLLLRRMALTRTYAGERLLAPAIWLAELFDPPAILFGGVLTPAVIGLFLAAVIRRLRTGG